MIDALYKLCYQNWDDRNDNINMLTNVLMLKMVVNSEHVKRVIVFDKVTLSYFY